MAFKVLWGPPCSGKSTYAQENMGEADIVVDYDRLSAAMTCNDIHDVQKRAYASRYVRACRGAIVSVVKDGEGDAENIWYLLTDLTDNVREWLKDLSPEYIKMQTTEEECLDRLEKDETRPDKDYWKKVIHEWFENNKKDDEDQRRKEVNSKMGNISEMLNKKISEGREFRNITPGSIQLRKQEDKGQIVEGYATTFNEQYLLYDWGDYKVYERIDARAFDECDMTDVIFQYNHEGRVMARTRNKTLELKCDNHGLSIRADLSGTELGRQLYEEIQGGYTDRMSFGFTVDEDKREIIENYGTNVTTVIRTITKIAKLYDVSAVSIPANDATEISARSFSDGLIRELEQERLKKRAREQSIEALKLLLEV